MTIINVLSNMCVCVCRGGGGGGCLGANRRLKEKEQRIYYSVCVWGEKKNSLYLRSERVKIL